jgi:hypothetical protein
MEFIVIDRMTLYVLIGGILVIFVGLALRHAESLQKTIPLWLWSGLAGILIGAGAASLTVYIIDMRERNEIARRYPPGLRQPPSTSGIAAPPASGMGSGAMVMSMLGSGGMPATGPTGGTTDTASSADAPGASAAPAVGGRTLRARDDLPALVARLELLTRGVHLKLDEQEMAALAAALEALGKDGEMTEEAANQHRDAINNVLTGDITELLQLIELPSGRGSVEAARGRIARSAPAGNGNGDGNARPTDGQRTPSVDEAGGRGGQESVDNPFKLEVNARRLQSLRERLSSAP